MAERNAVRKSESMQNISPSSDAVLNKYVVAGEIANYVMKELVKKCVSGASCRDLCILGDNLIIEETGKVFKKNKSIKKGVAFPTCVSLNECICHFSPLMSDPDQSIKDGDMVKIVLSVNIDGFIGGIAHTMVAGATEDNPVIGVKADILKAAYTAEEAILRILKVNKSNKDVGDIFNKIVVNEFNCKGVEDMVCFRVTKNNLEDEKKIIMAPGECHGKDYIEQKFELFEVYCIDVFVTNSEQNRPRQKDTRTTIYRRSDSLYNLKLKSSKELMRQVVTNSPHMAFNLRSMDNENMARMGIQECIKHDVVLPYPPLYVKEGNFVAHFQFTAIITPTGILRTTTHPWNDKLVKSEKKINDEAINKLLAESYNNKKKNSKAK